MVPTRRVKETILFQFRLSLKILSYTVQHKRKSLSPHIDQLTILLLKTVQKFTVKPQKEKKKKVPTFLFNSLLLF